MLFKWLIYFTTLNCLDGILKQSVKTSEHWGQQGCSRTKTVAHALRSKLLTQPLMKEAKQWVGVSWTKPFSPNHISARDAGRQETEALFSRLFPMESAPCGCRHQGRLWGHWSPSGNETSHTQETIWSFSASCVHLTLCLSGHQPVICVSRGSTCCCNIYAESESTVLC